MTASNTTTRSNAAAKNAAAAQEAKNVVANAQAKTKAKIAIFTRASAKVQAMLFVTVSDNARAPIFGGSIAGEKVSAFLRHPAGKTPFLSFVNKDGDQVGTANVRIREKGGVPTLKAILTSKEGVKTEAWFSVSKNVSDETLALLGAKMEKLHQKAVAA